MKICGVYCWTNKINNKKYIGVSVNIYKRWKQHIKLSKDGKNRKFYDAVRKYGEENFKKEILEEFKIFDKKKMKEREDHYINLYDSLKNGYNTELGYNTITDHPNIEEIKNKISQKAKRRRWVNNGVTQLTTDIDNINEYINNGWKLGRLKFSGKHIKSLSDSHKGHSPTKETRIKLSKLWLGKNHSEETKQMMSNKLKGRYSLEWYINNYGEKIGKEKHTTHHNKSKKHNTGKICVNNGKINRMIPKKELSLYIEQNWKKGRLTNK